MLNEKTWLTISTPRGSDQPLKEFLHYICIYIMNIIIIQFTTMKTKGNGANNENTNCPNCVSVTVCPLPKGTTSCWQMEA